MSIIPEAVTDQLRKRVKTSTHSQIRIIIKLFTPIELFVYLVNLIENLPDYIFETCLGIILQLTFVLALYELCIENVLKNKS